MRILAALALLMQLCWPFAGQLRGAEPQMVQVICTVHGLMSIPADEAPDAGKPRPACALCSAAAFALPTSCAEPAAQASAFEILGPAEVPARSRSYHSSSRPRAPPAFT